MAFNDTLWEHLSKLNEDHESETLSKEYSIVATGDDFAPADPEHDDGGFDKDSGGFYYGDNDELRITGYVHGNIIADVSSEVVLTWGCIIDAKVDEEEGKAVEPKIDRLRFQVPGKYAMLRPSEIAEMLNISVEDIDSQIKPDIVTVCVKAAEDFIADSDLSDPFGDKAHAEETERHSDNEDTSFFDDADRAYDEQQDEKALHGE